MLNKRVVTGAKKNAQQQRMTSSSLHCSWPKEKVSALGAEIINSILLNLNTQTLLLK